MLHGSREVQAKLWTTDTSSLVAPWSPSPQCRCPTISFLPQERMVFVFRYGFSWDKWRCTVVRVYFFHFSSPRICFNSQSTSNTRHVSMKIADVLSIGKTSQPVQDHLLLILFHLFIGGSCGRKTAYCCHQRRHGGLRGLASSCESKFCRGFGICHAHLASVPQTVFWPNLYRVKDIDVGAWCSKAFLQADLSLYWYHLDN